MQIKNLILLIILGLVYQQLAFAEEINVTDADYIWNLSLDNATSVGRLDGGPDVMVVKYADAISYTPLENATDVNHLGGEPDLIVVKYADVIWPNQLSNPVAQGNITTHGSVNLTALPSRKTVENVNSSHSIGIFNNQYTDDTLILRFQIRIVPQLPPLIRIR